MRQNPLLTVQLSRSAETSHTSSADARLMVLSSHWGRSAMIGPSLREI